MYTIDLMSNFQRDGFLVIEDFFCHELMVSLEKLIRSYFGDNPDFIHNDEFLDAAQTDVIPWFPQNEGVAAFDAIDGDPRLRNLTPSYSWRWLAQPVLHGHVFEKGQCRTGMASGLPAR